MSRRCFICAPESCEGHTLQDIANFVGALAEQPAPKKTDGPHIADLVLADIAERKRIGINRYGTPLQAHNGRNALRDAYEEALDLAIYLRQALEEQK